MATDDQPDPVLAPFRHPDDAGRLPTAADMLGTTDFLDVNRRLTAQIEAAVKAAVDNDGKAVVTLKLEIVPEDDGTVSFVPTVTAKLPERRVRRARLFHDPKGRLFLFDPMQPTLSTNKREI